MNYDYLPLYHPANIDGCTLHRTFLPFCFLYEQEELNSISRKTLIEALEECKLVSFNRQCPIEESFLLECQKKTGFKIVVDIDDWIELPHGHAIKKFWDAGKMGEKLKHFIEIADAVTVTTPRLAGKVRAINPNVFVIPNAVPFESRQLKEAEQFLNKKTESTVTRFGYIGGSTHLPDLKHIEPVFQKMGIHWNFSLCGFNNKALEKSYEHNTWNFMERICSFNHHNPNYKRVLTKPVNEYMNLYDDIDAVLVPLEPNGWSACKSSLKCYEAGVKKTAAIVQGCAPYTDDVPRDVVTYCSKNIDWFNAIKKHKDLSFVRDQGEKLFSWVKENRNLETVTQLRKETYDQIIYGQEASAKIISIATKQAA
jgi:hypothetical protein